MVRERECIHRKLGPHGEYYSGESYVQALQLLRGDRAVKVAGRVGAFFWSDAPITRVWLCDECAADMGYKEKG